MVLNMVVTKTRGADFTKYILGVRTRIMGRGRFKRNEEKLLFCNNWSLKEELLFYCQLCFVYLLVGVCLFGFYRFMQIACLVV
jgi:hypothetical protein